MNICGKFRLFVNDKEYENDKGVPCVYKTFTTSLAREDEDGLTDKEYIRAFLDVRFSNNMKEAYELDDYEEGTCLEVEVDEGWLDFRFWEDGDGNIRKQFYVFVNAGSVEEYVPQEKPKAKDPAKKAAKPAAKTPAKKNVKKTSKK